MPTSSDRSVYIRRRTQTLYDHLLPTALKWRKNRWVVVATNLDTGEEQTLPMKDIMEWHTTKSYPYGSHQRGGRGRGS